MSKLRGLSKKGAERNIKLYQLKSMNSYQFEIKEEKGKTYLICRRKFTYKGKEQEAVNSREIDFKEGDKIAPELQQEAAKEVDKSINEYKLTN